MKAFRILATFICITILASCLSASNTALPELLDPISIGKPANLSPIAEIKLNNCFNTIPARKPLITTYHIDTLDENQYDLIIWSGDKEDLTSYSSDDFMIDLIFEEEVTFIVSSDNDLDSISAEELRSILTGQTGSWDNFPDSSLSGDIQVWSYFQDHPIRKFIEQNLIVNHALTSSAKLAPTQLDLIKSVSDNSNAIGFVYESLVDSTVNTLTITKLGKLLIIPTYIIVDEDNLVEYSPIFDCLTNNR